MQGDEPPLRAAGDRAGNVEPRGKFCCPRHKKRRNRRHFGFYPIDKYAERLDAREWNGFFGTCHFCLKREKVILHVVQNQFEFPILHLGIFTPRFAPTHERVELVEHA